MKTILNNLTKAFALFCLATISLHGSLQPVGLQSVSEEERIEYALQMQTEQEGEEVLRQERTVINPYNAFDYSQYLVYSIGYQGTTITLGDGSIWSVRPSDGWISADWNDNFFVRDAFSPTPSKVYITANKNWLFDKSYLYTIVNDSTGESVYCNLSQTAPTEENTLRIQYIDYTSGYVELMNNNVVTLIQLNRSDYDVYRKWSAGDRIMRGRNTGWFANSYPYLLINVETLTNARCDLK